MTTQPQSARRAATLATFAHWHRSNSGQFLKTGVPQAPAYVLPRQLAPISTASAVDYLWGDRSDSPGPALDNARRASWCALNHPRLSTQFPQLNPRDSVPLAAWCPCLPYTADSLKASSRAAITTHETISRFDPDALVTETTTNLTVENASNEIWKRMAEGSDPANWMTQAPDFFKLSEPTKEFEPKKLDPAAVYGWKGTLHEVFEWNWNSDYTASYDNILNIDFFGDVPGNTRPVADGTTVTVEYSLQRCNSTNLLLVNQTGGLDVDKGELVLRRKGTTIAVTARKSIRYTQPQLAPDGFSSMIAFLTPSVLALWLDQSVTQGVASAIQPDDPPRKDWGGSTALVETELSGGTNGARGRVGPTTRPEVTAARAPLPTK